MRYLLPILLLGCKTTQEGGLSVPFLQAASEVPNTDLAHALSPLKFSGTLLILTGSALLFATQGRRGWIPIALGIGLTVLMAILASVLSSQMFIYSLIAVLCLTAGIAALNLKEIRLWIKFMRSSQLPLDTSSPSPQEHGSDSQSSAG
tara:strand:+ start:225 stop:668 length:444 start_codon:yes stop_codon:yes gene_type:complete